MKATRLHLAGWHCRRLAGLALALCACSEAHFERAPTPPPAPRDNRIRIVGEFCTDDPDELQFPVKVLLIVDCSLSLDTTDPPNPVSRRVAAVLELIELVEQAQADVSVAVERFEGAANVLTQVDSDQDGRLDRDGFTSDGDMLRVAAGELARTAATTDYDGALALAFALLDTDLRNADAVTRARSRYVVIFLSDGMPDPVDANHNNPTTILRRVDEIRNLADAFGVGELRLHTAYLATGQPLAVQQPAIDLLKSMAAHGGGTLRNYDNGEAIHFLRFDLTSLKRIFALKRFVAFNANARPQPGDVLPDSDGDGLADDHEQLLGTDFRSPDTDGDGFSDFLENKLQFSGYDPLAGHDASCHLENDRADSDGDGLADCEERFLGTSPALIDSDADGLPDGVEAVAGTNPSLPDADTDLDEDGTPNGDEVAGQTDPGDPDAAYRARTSARYALTALGQEAGRQCYAFEVDNLALAATAAARDGGPASAGANVVRLMFGETPFDSPAEPGTFRVACVRARYDALLNATEPLSGVIQLRREDFHAPLELTAEHCVGGAL